MLIKDNKNPTVLSANSMPVFAVVYAKPYTMELILQGNESNEYT